MTRAVSTICIFIFINSLFRWGFGSVAFSHRMVPHKTVRRRGSGRGVVYLRQRMECVKKRIGGGSHDTWRVSDHRMQKGYVRGQRSQWDVTRNLWNCQPPQAFCLYCVRGTVQSYNPSSSLYLKLRILVLIFECNLQQHKKLLKQEAMALFWAQRPFDSHQQKPPLSQIKIWWWSCTPVGLGGSSAETQM